VLHVSKEQAQGGSDSHLRDPKTGRELEVVDKVRAWVGRDCVCGCWEVRGRERVGWVGLVGLVGCLGWLVWWVGSVSCRRKGW
jgi:hypothetical protein